MPRHFGPNDTAQPRVYCHTRWMVLRAHNDRMIYDGTRRTYYTIIIISRTIDPLVDRRLLKCWSARFRASSSSICTSGHVCIINNISSSSTPHLFARLSINSPMCKQSTQKDALKKEKKNKRCHNKIVTPTSHSSSRRWLLNTSQVSMRFAMRHAFCVCVCDCDDARSTDGVWLMNGQMCAVSNVMRINSVERSIFASCNNSQYEKHSDYSDGRHSTKRSVLGERAAHFVQNTYIYVFANTEHSNGYMQWHTARPQTAPFIYDFMLS